MAAAAARCPLRSVPERPQGRRRDARREGKVAAALRGRGRELRGKAGRRDRRQGGRQAGRGERGLGRLSAPSKGGLGASPPAPTSEALARTDGKRAEHGGGGLRGREAARAPRCSRVKTGPQAAPNCLPEEGRASGRALFPEAKTSEDHSLPGGKGEAVRRQTDVPLTSENIISKMVWWIRQTSRYSNLLNTYSIIKSIELRRQLIKTWTLFHVPSTLRWRSCKYFCQPLLKNYRNLHLDNHMRLCSSSTELSRPSLSLVDGTKPEIIPSSDSIELPEGLEDVLPLCALEEISEDEALQIVAEPPLPLESFSLQDYVDHSETLHKLVLLGVNLSKIEKRSAAGQLLLRLDFENDIKKILLFLKDIGLEDTQLGAFLTKNPYILREDVEDLKTRVTYLISKKFTKEAVTQMVTKAPYLLLFSVERLDNRLGFFQNELGLNPRKIRNIVTRLPRLLTGKLEPIKENLKVYELELGFTKDEIRHIAHAVPKNISMKKKKLTEIFDYVHNIMGVPHKMMVLFPQIFNTKLLRIKERHMFLTFLGRAQYDPGQPSYISLERLIALPDNVFCAEIAKAELKDFETFLKTL